MDSATASVLGEVGLPAPVSERASRSWDTIFEDTGHNGPACYIRWTSKNSISCSVVFTRARLVDAHFVPFLDGSTQLWDEDDRCEEEVRVLAPDDVEGWKVLADVIRRLRDKLRPCGSIIGINGRNAAMTVFQDLEKI